MLVFLLVLVKWPYVRIGRPIFKRNFHEIRTDTCLFQRNKIRIQALSQSIRDRSFAAAPQVNVVIGTGPTGQGESGFSIRVCSSLGQWPKEATYGRGSKFVPYALAISEAASMVIFQTRLVNKFMIVAPEARNRDSYHIYTNCNWTCKIDGIRWEWRGIGVDRIHPQML